MENLSTWKLSVDLSFPFLRCLASPLRSTSFLSFLLPLLSSPSLIPFLSLFFEEVSCYIAWLRLALNLRSSCFSHPNAEIETCTMPPLGFL